MISPDRINQIGILTGGGDCPGLNAVIRAAVKTALIQNGWKAVGIEDGFEGLVGDGKTRSLVFDDVKDIIDKGGTILGASNRANPFDYRTCIKKKVVSEDRSSQLTDKLKELELDALIIIGGDGTLSIAAKMHTMGIPLVGVPKTIDNDIGATDITFGFDTAVNTATEAIDKIRTTGESHHRVMVVEVMGRYAGWIALNAGIASGADIILIPEIPFRLDEICRVIKDRIGLGRRHSIVVVAEGAKSEGGDIMVKRIVKNSPDTVRLGGIGKMLADKIASEISIEARDTVLGHIQRGGSPSAFDRVLATRFGAGAVGLLADGGFGRMVCLHNTRIESVPIEDAVRQLKKVTPELDIVTAAKATGVSFGI